LKLVGALLAALTEVPGAQQASGPPPPDPASQPAPPIERPEFREEAIGPAPGVETVGLGRSMALALDGNYALLAAADSLQRARLQHGDTLAQFYPKLTPSYRRSSDDSSFGVELSQKLPWTGGSIKGSAGLDRLPQDKAPLDRESDLSLTLTQPLLRGLGPNAAFFDLRNSRRAKIAQERAFELQKQRLLIQVAEAYYGVLLQRTLLGVARQSLRRNQALLRASEARLKVGLVSKLDVFRAELLAAQARESEVAALTSLQSALETFRFHLGLGPSTPLEPEAGVLPDDVRDSEEPLEVLVSRALADRLDLQEVRDQVDDARRAASLARQDLLPQLDLSLGFTRSGKSSTFSDAWNLADHRVSLSFSTSYPLETTASRTRAALAGIDVEVSRRNLRQSEQEVETEVRGAVRNLDHIRTSLELQRRAVEVAEQQYRLALLRYERGLASNFDVGEAEGYLVAARSALASLLKNHQVARLELLRATGSLDPNREFAP
jgi:outer membrane protein TolC